MSVEITCLTIDIFRLEVGLLTPVEVAQPARRPRRLHVVLHVPHVDHVLNKINTCQPAQEGYTMPQLLRPPPLTLYVLNKIPYILVARQDYLGSHLLTKLFTLSPTV
jgi:hypothetical protein